jgi:hypothetical protein
MEDSPAALAWKLERQINEAEGKARELIRESEARLNDRIRKLEKELISRGVLCLPELDTLLKWMFGVWLGVLALLVFVTDSSDSDLVQRSFQKTEQLPPVRESDEPAPQGTAPHEEWQ